MRATFRLDGKINDRFDWKKAKLATLKQHRSHANDKLPPLWPTVFGGFSTAIVNSLRYWSLAKAWLAAASILPFCLPLHLELPLCLFLSLIPLLKKLLSDLRLSARSSSVAGADCELLLFHELWHVAFFFPATPLDVVVVVLLLFISLLYNE